MHQSSKWLAILAGIVYAGLGLYLIFNPAINILSIAWAISFAIFVGGISDVVDYFARHRAFRNFWQLVGGVLTVLFGLILISGGYVVLPVAIPQVIAIWLIVYGIIRLISAYKVKDIQPLISKFLLVTGIITILLGILLWFQPLLTSLAASYLIAFVFLYHGISTLFDAFKR
ncbi:TPA: HdeD family acid-resistance protein [Streptococcus suis]